MDIAPTKKFRQRTFFLFYQCLGVFFFMTCETFLPTSNKHQCYQAENQTKKAQNQTCMRPYFYQKSDQTPTRTRHFKVKIRLVPKTFLTSSKSTFIKKKYSVFKEFFNYFFCCVWKANRVKITI